MEIRSIGIDLGKTTFHLIPLALDRRGESLVRRKFTQKQLLTYTANLQTCLIRIRRGLHRSSFSGTLFERARPRPMRMIHPFVGVIS